jgi:hypothetical protein
MLELQRAKSVKEAKAEIRETELLSPLKFEIR